MTYLGRNVSEFDKAHLVSNDVGKAGVQNHTDSSVTWLFLREVFQCLRRWKMRRKQDLYRTGWQGGNRQMTGHVVVLERIDPAIFFGYKKENSADILKMSL